MTPGFAAEVIAAVCVEAKAFARVTASEEDALFARLAESALGLAEAFLRVSLIVRAHRAVLPAAAVWQVLPVGPVTEISTVEGLPADGAAFALPVGSYAIDVDAGGDGWVRVTAPGSAGRVAVTYAAGLASDWAGVPGPVAQGVVRLTGHLYATRDGMGPVPAAVTALWRPFRRIDLMGRERGRERGWGRC